MRRYSFIVIIYLILVTISGRLAWAEDEGSDKHIKTYFEPVTGMEFARIPGGCFIMGNQFGKYAMNDEAAHEVCLDEYWMSKYEVTVKQWQQFINDIGHEIRWSFCNKFQADQFVQDDSHPVTCVSFFNSKEFSTWLTKKTGKEFRLPTEAEWEFAARSGGKEIEYPWGAEEPVCDKTKKNGAKFDDNKLCDDKGTDPVGSYTPNEWGLYDMAGNISEWCQDRYGSDYYKKSPQNNPQGPLSGEFRVLRGGSWFNSSRLIRTTSRSGSLSTKDGYDKGFRLVFSENEVQQTKD